MPAHARADDSEKERLSGGDFDGDSDEDADKPTSSRTGVSTGAWRRTAALLVTFLGCLVGSVAAFSQMPQPPTPSPQPPARSPPAPSKAPIEAPTPPPPLIQSPPTDPPPANTFSPPASPTPPRPSRPGHPSPPSHLEQRVVALNRRLLEGRPSNHLEMAGVIVHQFESSDGDTTPWLPCSQYNGRGQTWCHTIADRWAATLVNDRARSLYYQGVGGVVLSPNTTRCYCAYPQDGNSLAKVCAHLGGSDDGSCIPGCFPRGQQCPDYPSWRWWECSFPPSMLRDAMQCQVQIGNERGSMPNNEIVVQSRSVVDHLPYAIEGFFIRKGSEAAYIEWVARVHAAFITAYGLGDQRDSHRPPLMVLDLKSATEPFTLWSGPQSV